MPLLLSSVIMFVFLLSALFLPDEVRCPDSVLDCFFFSSGAILLYLEYASNHLLCFGSTEIISPLLSSADREKSLVEEVRAGPMLSFEMFSVRELVLTRRVNRLDSGLQSDWLRTNFPSL